MVAVTGFTRCGDGGKGLRGVWVAEQPGRGHGLREGCRVGERVGGGGEERRGDRGGRWSLL